MKQCQLFNLISGFFFGGPAAETRDGQADRNVGILSHRRGKAGAGAIIAIDQTRSESQRNVLASLDIHQLKIVSYNYFSLVLLQIFSMKCFQFYLHP
jgi:hypothetical protein